MRIYKIRIVGILLLLLIPVGLFYLLLEFNFLQSDIAAYWQDSLNWQAPFHKFHVPGYPLVIAFLRGISFGIFPPIILMQLITFISLVFSFFYLEKIFKKNKILKNNYILFLLGLFTLWPFVGISTIVFPLADIVALSLFIIGLFFFIHNKHSIGSILWGLSLITHKAIWVFVVFAFMALFISYKDKKIMDWAKSAIIILFPIFILWLSGSFYHQDSLWLVSSNLEVEFQSKGTLPIMDGLIGTLLSGGLRAVVKGGLILFVFASSIILGVYLWIKKPSHWQIGIAVCLSVFILSISLNQHEIWAAVRFGRLLVIPLAFVFPLLIEKISLSKKVEKTIIYTILFLLYVSQFTFAYYMAKIFFN
ncbi:MAG: hypothetical protein CVU40_10140 [Chloroflexi bacterium HGW-Chloroflexi-2]|jgi:hypothetical protein|nr:MAG: hypothetical protein CVU40_10140 [Chloroflexi bacterium HGW-Chloroflexi-2]